jgi:hypothetical protein
MLQDDFFLFVKQAFDRKYIELKKIEKKKWHRCFIVDKTVFWMQKPNMDGSFWVFVSISFKDINRRISGLKYNLSSVDTRKYLVSLLGCQMEPIDLLDRGISARGGWEASWPVGFKIRNNSQFELATKIILSQ